MLDSDAQLMRLGNVQDLGLSPTDPIFVRPDQDPTEFAGQVVTFGALRTWQEQVSPSGGLFDDQCQVAVAQPVGIASEWRLFRVSGRVVSGSHYRSDGRVKVRAVVPHEVVEFGERAAARRAPAKVFVLDIGKSGDGLYVIEAGCFNSAGFYAANIDRLVDAVSAACSWPPKPRHRVRPPRDQPASVQPQPKPPYACVP